MITMDLIDVIVDETLVYYGFNPCLAGYKYLSDSIMIVLKDSSKIRYVTKFLYPEVSKINGVTAGTVGRSIRRVIRRAWDDGNRYIREDFAEFNNHHERMPSNIEFIAFMAMSVRNSLIDIEGPAERTGRVPAEFFVENRYNTV